MCTIQIENITTNIINGKNTQFYCRNGYSFFNIFATSKTAFLSIAQQKKQFHEKLPCNQPYTMTVDQLVNAARMVNPKVLFPYHYGQTDVSGIPSQLEADGTDVRIRHYE